jgi:two-component system, OmpR family, alkaline phosphatase synthesis response regulator PhoP
MSGKILIADDEPSVRDSVGYALKQEGFDVTLAVDGSDAEGKLTGELPYDLLILDIMMPGRSGLDICREVRGRSAVPIIILTAKDAEVDKVVGLEVGADDYVTKPVSPAEVVSRVRAHLRRRRMDAHTASMRYEFSDLVVDLSRRHVWARGERVELTTTEFEILSFLAAHPGWVYTRKQIMQHLWDGDFYGDVRSADVHVQRIRKKIEPDPKNPRYIHTVRGMGYRFSDA